MAKRADDREDNVILFPGLVSKLVDRGMSALKEKKYFDALTYFQQSTDLEPEHPQARYGLVITNIELNRLQEARLHCESMLNEGIGEYYDIVKVYVSLLIQIGDYQQVVDILEGLLEEDKLPSSMAESFFHILSFARQMTENDEPIVEEDRAVFSTPKEDLLTMLEDGSVDQQWGAIQQLSNYELQDVIEAYRVFLKGKQNNPVLKSYVLQMLKELDADERVDVHKFGQDYQVDIATLENVFHEDFGKAVLDRLEEVLNQKNPSLLEVIQQVWWHYLFALYPKKPVPADIDSWACSLHITGFTMLGFEEEEESIIGEYDTDKERVAYVVSQLKEVEGVMFSPGLDS
ncbi:tetratricopeptide repeat protein [Paenalkalicoccus suaedae]|uniref:Tetratricopeptide repeat protein n=1 Tax=Paenalkalicoccus suaedae TaxID=2592382 RepID=A0A859FGE3_9BACI|nr:tetratricopeptide repeat protein [Paenalkalicoccus suaedae]QKS71888.1 tetratricopeptide repeat protein [Paenalkalicoccus suaedae]